MFLENSLNKNFNLDQSTQFNLLDYDLLISDWSGIYLEYLIQNSLPNVTIITPNERGCQLSLVVPGGRKVFDTISEKSIICDWREPDVIRIAPHPLFNTFLDIFCFVEILKKSI